MNRLFLTAMSALALVLCACASTSRMSDAERLALHRAHAGAPVASMPLRGQLDGWTSLGNGALVVWTRPREAWLLDLGGPCHDLEYATAIAVNSSFSRIQARFDSITPLGAMVGQVGRIPCRIMEIRPLDSAALKQARDELREATVLPDAGAQQQEQ